LAAQCATPSSQAESLITRFAPGSLTTMQKHTNQPTRSQIILTGRDAGSLIAGYVAHERWLGIEAATKMKANANCARSYIRDSFSAFVLEADQDSERETMLDYSRVASINGLIVDPLIVLGPATQSSSNFEDSIRDQKRVLRVLAALANERQGGPVISSTLDKILAGLESQN
jgi:hypothetical protein